MKRKFLFALGMSFCLLMGCSNKAMNGMTATSASNIKKIQEMENVKDLKKPDLKDMGTVNVNLSTITVEVPKKYEVTDEMVNEHIDTIREDNMVSIDGRESQMGDTVNIDYVGTENGKEFAGGSATDFNLILGSDAFPKGFEDQLVGKKKGDTVDIQITFPEDYGIADLKGKKVLVTAGPTKEFIDPFRCLTNPSTGKMGIAIANEFKKRGAEVILVTSVKNDSINRDVKIIEIISTNDMFEAVKNNFKDCDYIVKAAAVSDYTPVQVYDKKVKKQDGNLTMEFERTQDILKYVGENKTEEQIVVGFAAETNDLLAYAREKIVKKNLDYIVANDISKKDIGFGSEDNEVCIIDKFNNITKIDKTSKANIAKEIVDIISK